MACRRTSTASTSTRQLSAQGPRLAGEAVPPAPSATCPTWATTPSGCSTPWTSARAHLVGASMGGMLVQTMALDQPGAVPEHDVDQELTQVTREPASRRRRRYAGAHDAAAERAWCVRRRTRFTNGAVTGSKRCSEPGARRGSAPRSQSNHRAFYPEGAPAPAGGDLHQSRGPDEQHCTDLRRSRRSCSTAATTRSSPRAAAPLTAEAIPDASLLLLADMGHDIPRPCGGSS